MTDEEKKVRRAAVEELISEVPCCSCCGGEDRYREHVTDVAEILGFKIDWSDRHKGKIVE